MDVPFGTGGLQGLVALHRALAAGPADGQLHGQHRHAHDDQEHQVEQHEQAAAVLSHQEREAPHVPDADRAARADQDKAQPRAKGFTFHDFPPKHSNIRRQAAPLLYPPERQDARGNPPLPQKIV